MYRCQDNGWLSRDQFGGTLDPVIANQRLEEIFDYFGQTSQDVGYDAALAFAIDPEKELEAIDHTIVFLARHGNLPPQWVEQQPIPRQNRLVRILVGMIRDQYSSMAQPGSSDSTGEWL